MILLPDELHRQVWEQEIRDGIAEGNMLLFGHGFSIHYGEVTPPAGRRRGDGRAEGPRPPGAPPVHRRQRRAGPDRGRSRTPRGNARALALAYAKGIGCTRGGVIETTFKDETETDLFGEQAVLCGGASELVQAGFETLVEAGYDPEMAYFECLHELKLIADLMYEKGLAGMRFSISNTAEYGDYTRGKRVITEETRASMRKILSRDPVGDFAREWIAENRAGQENFKRMRAEQADTAGRARRQRAALAHGLDQAGLLRAEDARGAGLRLLAPPAEGVAEARPTSARCVRFHRSLARTPPVGLRGSRCSAASRAALARGDRRARVGGGYEDWYLRRGLRRARAC